MRMDAAGRTDAEDIHIFRVAVDDVLYILDVFRVQVSGPGHACFFIDGEDEAQRAMLDILLDEVQRQSDGNAVIGTEAGPIGMEDIAFTDQFDFTGQGVEVDAGFGDADHIHMALEDRKRPVFATLAGGDIGDDVIYFVLCDIGYAQFVEAADDVVANAFFVVGRTRVLGQSCKFMDDSFNDFLIVHMTNAPFKKYLRLIT